MPNGRWPDGPVLQSVEAPVAAATRWAAAVSACLTEALRGRNISEVSADSGVGRSTIYKVCAGDRWPDVLTVFRLQETLGIELIALDHLPEPPR